MQAQTGFKDQLDRTISSIHPQIDQYLSPIIHKYWSIYVGSHPPTSIQVTHPIVHVASIFTQLHNRPYFSLFTEIADQTSQYYEVAINYQNLLTKLKKINNSNDDTVCGKVIEIFQNIIYDSSVIIPALKLIIHNHFVSKGMKQKKVTLSIYNYPLIQMIQLKAHMVDTFVSVQAVIIKVQQIRLLSMSLEFTCFQCKSNFVHYFMDGIYSTPSKCMNNKKNCKSRTFIPLKDKMKTIFIQRIKVQQIDADGRVPRQMVCELRENHVGKVMTGQTVIITGIIKTESNDEKDKKTQGIFTPYMQVNSCQSMRAKNMMENDLQVIEKMKKDKHIFYSLIKSFCPTIFGHQLVKAGLLLGIIGGSNKNISHETSFRQTSHILLLGDPGIGKSQLLKFAVQILPHSVYVSATSMSHSGLTVAINKQNNQQSLEAGALILADNGICAIDEFDKATDSSALLQVMEQQTISIAKAGIICQLKCRVGIIASANPTQGCYNKNKTFMENTKISNAILSRFDLIFLMVDKPDEQRDKKLSQHIMNMHNQNRKKPPLHQNNPLKTKINESTNTYTSLNNKYVQLAETYGSSYGLQEVKKYLSYIRNSIHPTLSKQAADIIKSFYIVLRDNSPSASFQVTSRQLQSLVRLAMARARIQCREQVTEQDAYEVTQLMQESLFDSFEQMGYNINSLRHEGKKVKVTKKNGQLSLPKQRNLFVSTLNEMQQNRLGSIWQWGQLLRVAKDLQLNIGDFYSFIERLNQDGVLLQKGNKKYSFQGTYV